MGVYLNCGNEAFRRICNGTYIDKTGLIDYVNSIMETPDNLICFSRPRRFGKTFAATMLAAYYDRSCDSRALFQNLKIGQKLSFEKYLNHYDVIYLDITWFTSRSKMNGKNPVEEIQSSVIEELQEAFPGMIKETEEYLPNAVLSIYRKTGRSFFFIIDEWDALFREAKENENLQKSYVQLLRGLFKSGPAMKAAISGAYMTGILPIKKYGTESALTDFREFTMTQPGKLAEYVGFTEPEVKELCLRYDMDFENMRTWYDGYSFNSIQHVYGPNSVMHAIKNEEFGNYWTTSETYESLKDYISMNYDGLEDAVIAMLGGQRIGIETLSFQNDMISFRSKDDVITLLIHLGYLAYDSAKSEAYIPNLEVAESFKLAIQNTGWCGVSAALRASEELLNATIAGNSDAVAAALDEIHSSESSVLQYNDENSLSCAVTIAYYTAKNYYTVIRELPSGKGFADLTFLPRQGSDKPAMIIELKYNKTADSAIQQIKARRYEGALKDYQGNLLLVGINYDKSDKKKHHSCAIERWKAAQ